MRPLIYLLPLIGLSLSACTTNPKDYQKQLANTPSCCQQLAGIYYHPITYNKPITVNIGGKKSPARHFPEGKSFFAALSLPAYTSPYEVQITSEPIGKQVLWPSVQILDSNFQLVKELGADTFTYSNGEMKNNFFINKDLGYSYLVFYTKPKSVGRAGEMRAVGANSIYMPTGTGAVGLSYGVDKKQSIMTAAGGQLRLELIKYQPRALK